MLMHLSPVDGSTRWRRVYQLGSKAELLAVVKQAQREDGDGKGDGPISVRRGDLSSLEVACCLRLSGRLGPG